MQAMGLVSPRTTQLSGVCSLYRWAWRLGTLGLESALRHCSFSFVPSIFSSCGFHPNTIFTWNSSLESQIPFITRQSQFRNAWASSVANLTSRGLSAPAAKNTWPLSCTSRGLYYTVPMWYPPFTLASLTGGDPV